MCARRWKKRARCPLPNKMKSASNDERVFNAAQAMLEHMHRKQDHSALVESIRARFPNGRSLYRANRHLWERIGLRPNDALLFSLIKDVVRCARISEFGEHPPMGNLDLAAPYLNASFIGLGVEHFYMFCINRRGSLKERILLSEGIADTALFDLRRLLMEVVRLRPLGGVIIAHNHPGGTMRPSQDDIDCTLEAIEALTALNAPLLDHLIVADGKVVSLRQNGFIPEEQWLNQNPRHRLLCNWLPGENISGHKKKKANPN